MAERESVVEALLYVKWPDTRTEHLIRIRRQSLRPGVTLTTTAGKVRVVEVATDDRLPVLVYCTGQERVTDKREGPAPRA